MTVRKLRIRGTVEEAVEEYSKALDVVYAVGRGMIDEESVHAILLVIAKEHPEVLVAAYEKRNAVWEKQQPDEHGVMSEDREEVFQKLKAGKKIQAIKHVRAVMGWGLKEAKQYVDEFHERMIRERLLPET